MSFLFYSLQLLLRRTAITFSIVTERKKELPIKSNQFFLRRIKKHKGHKTREQQHQRLVDNSRIVFYLNLIVVDKIGCV